MKKVTARQAEFDRQAELDQLQSLVEIALKRAAKQGASAAAARTSMHRGLAVNVRLDEVETLEHTQDRSIGVTVYNGHSKGSASSADLTLSSIQESVDRAMDIAQYTQADTCHGLADAELMASEFKDLDLWHPSELDVQQAIALARRCEAAGRASSTEIKNSEGGSFSSGLGLSVYGNSHGFIGRHSGTRHSLSCTLVAGSGEQMQSDYWYDSARCIDDMSSAEAIGQRAAQRAVQRLRPRQIPTGEIPVLFAADIAKGVIEHFVGAVSGGALYRDASFLKDCIGQQLFPKHIRMTEYPHLLRGSGSAVFDAEGVATQQRDLVADGVLNGYLLSSYSARKLGMRPTGNAGGAHNLCVSSGEDDFSALLKTMGSGLLITEVMGQGINLVTGDYSRGAAGFWVEQGEIQYPVSEVTIAANLRDMFQDIIAVGTDVDTRGSVQTGSLLVEKMMVAGE